MQNVFLLFCVLFVFIEFISALGTHYFIYRSTNWDEVAKKDYENKDRPSAPEG